MQAELIKVGRAGITKVIEVGNINPLFNAEKECRKHCMSRNIWLSETADPQIFIVNAGMHTVGKVVFSETITEEHLEKYQ